MKRRWIVLAERSRRRWGGDLRRYYLFESLSARTGAVIPQGWTKRYVVPLLPRRRRHVPWFRPKIASVELLEFDVVDEVIGRAAPVVLDIHDDPVLQADAIGSRLDPADRRRQMDLMGRNVDAFPVLVAPSASFADLAGLERSRVLVASNGSDTRLVTPGPWPSEPAIGMISGAAPGRGIETLVAAVRMTREQIPDLRLMLWLVATSDQAQAYLDELIAELRPEPWVEFGSAAYLDLGAALARSTILCVPHLGNPYLETASPVKLFDGMASGRPTVVTPRFEMARVVEKAEAGLVARGDRPEDLAECFERLLSDETLAQLLGANARRAAVADYDWHVVSSRLADAILRR